MFAGIVVSKINLVCLSHCSVTCKSSGSAELAFINGLCSRNRRHGQMTKTSSQSYVVGPTQPFEIDLVMKQKLYIVGRT